MKRPPQSQRGVDQRQQPLKQVREAEQALGVLAYGSHPGVPVAPVLREVSGLASSGKAAVSGAHARWVFGVPPRRCAGQRSHDLCRGSEREIQGQAIVTSVTMERGGRLVSR